MTVLFLCHEFSTTKLISCCLLSAEVCVHVRFMVCGHCTHPLSCLIHLHYTHLYSYTDLRSCNCEKCHFVVQSCSMSYSAECLLYSLQLSLTLSPELVESAASWISPIMTSASSPPGYTVNAQPPAVCVFTTFILHEYTTIALIEGSSAFGTLPVIRL